MENMIEEYKTRGRIARSVILDIQHQLSKEINNLYNEQVGASNKDSMRIGYTIQGLKKAISITDKYKTEVIDLLYPLP